MSKVYCKDCLYVTDGYGQHVCGHPQNRKKRDTSYEMYEYRPSIADVNEKNNCRLFESKIHSK